MRSTSLVCSFLLTIVLGLGATGCSVAQEKKTPSPSKANQADKTSSVQSPKVAKKPQDKIAKLAVKNVKPRPVVWDGAAIPLIEKSALGGWETVSFGGEGDCRVEKGTLTIESGDPMTGVTWTRKGLPKSNYEINLEARRTDGLDFFCGLIFPVNDSHCCLIVGGWAGAIVGLSNIDDKDASSNETKKLMLFEDKQWYKFRIRVFPKRIMVWIDGKMVINQNIDGKKISLRGDTEILTPLGLCTFQTTSETRKMTLRKFKGLAKKTKPGVLQKKPKAKTESSKK